MIVANWSTPLFLLQMEAENQIVKNLLSLVHFHRLGKSWSPRGETKVL